MLLEKLVETIADHTAKLDELADEQLDLTNWRNLYLVLHTLQVHAQATIDFPLHTCSLLGIAAPTPIACINKLKARGYLEEEEAETLKKMARFKNIVSTSTGR